MRGGEGHQELQPCRAAAQPGEPRTKLRDAGANCRSQLFPPAMDLFSCLGATQAFLLQLSAVMRAKTEDSVGAGNQGFRVTSGCWEREDSAWPGRSIPPAFHSSPSQPSDLTVPPGPSRSPCRRQLGLFPLLFLVSRVVTAGSVISPPQPAERGMGCDLRELLCPGSCGSGKTLECLICNQHFPGLRTSGRERLGFSCLEPLEVLGQDLCWLFALFFLLKE